MGKKVKRGLVVIYDPHSLLQFLWYVCTYAKDVQWDALCLPNEGAGTCMKDDCVRAAIFNRVYSDNVDYLNMSLVGKARLLIQMLFFYIINQKQEFAKKIFNTYVDDVDVYDEIVSITDTGFVSGLSALFAKNKKISYLDDGLLEYYDRSLWSNLAFPKSSFNYWQSLIMRIMGYGCKGGFYFYPTADCYKYVAIPSEVRYRNYREIVEMSFEQTDLERYQKSIKEIYYELNDVDFESVTAVFFTDNMEYFSSNYQEYYDKCTQYVSQRHKAVLLKRHSRDFATYSFGSDTTILEVRSTIPAEIMLPYLSGKDLYFECFSSIIIFMHNYKYDCNIFYSKKLYEENQEPCNRKWILYSRDELEGFCNRFAKGKYNIIDLD